VEGPLGNGVAVYSNCASCHGADGGGGVGYPFTGGEVLKTFPHIADQVRWVYYGTEGYNAADIPVYGIETRDGGAHVTGEQGVMPAFGTQLSGADIVAVVCHERYTLGGADPTSEEFEETVRAWCSPDSPIFTALESGDLDLTTGEMPEVLDAAATRSMSAWSVRRRLLPATEPNRRAVASAGLGADLTRDPSREPPREPPLVTSVGTDVLVVGGGPSGNPPRCGWRRSGRVTLVEEARHPRHKACGDVLTHGQSPNSPPRRRSTRRERSRGRASDRGVRPDRHRREITEPWPDHPDLPDHGVALRRGALDGRSALASRGRRTVLMGHGPPRRSPTGFRPRRHDVDRRRGAGDPPLRRGGRWGEQPVRPPSARRGRTTGRQDRGTELLDQPHSSVTGWRRGSRSPTPTARRSAATAGSLRSATGR
jgi:hypothetical protein